MKHSEITEKIIGAFYRVYNELGYGFLENVYLNALGIELVNIGLEIEKEREIKVYYQNQIVGKYRADIIVNNLIIIEIKANEFLINENENQLVNYLKATEIEVGLLLNFGSKPEICRKLYDNNLKKHFTIKAHG